MVAQLVDKILSCCGENEFLKSKLPWNKHGNNNKNDDDEDVADHKPTKTSHFNKKSKFSDKDMKYENCKWKNLPIKVRKAVQGVGLDEEQWDDDSDDADVFQKHWEDLEDKEKEVMELLGWDEAAWENMYEDISWEDLPEHVKKAAAAAGFEEDTWESDEWPDNLHTSWAELSDVDRDAMRVLGWYESKWD